MEITKQSCSTIRDTMEKQLKVLEDMGLAVSLSGGRFVPGVEFRLTVTVNQKGAQVVPTVVGKEGPKIGDHYHFRGHNYTYERYDKRKWKNPHILRNETNGKSYKFSDFALSMGKKL